MQSEKPTVITPPLVNQIGKAPVLSHASGQGGDCFSYEYPKETISETTNPDGAVYTFDIGTNRVYKTEDCYLALEFEATNGTTAPSGTSAGIYNMMQLFENVQVRYNGRQIYNYFMDNMAYITSLDVSQEYINSQPTFFIRGKSYDKLGISSTASETNTLLFTIPLSFIHGIWSSNLPFSTLKLTQKFELYVQLKNDMTTSYTKVLLGDSATNVTIKLKKLRLGLFYAGSKSAVEVYGKAISSNKYLIYNGYNWARNTFSGKVDGNMMTQHGNKSHKSISKIAFMLRNGNKNINQTYDPSSVYLKKINLQLNTGDKVFKVDLLNSHEIRNVTMKAIGQNANYDGGLPTWFNDMSTKQTIAVLSLDSFDGVAFDGYDCSQGQEFIIEYEIGGTANTDYTLDVVYIYDVCNVIKYETQIFDEFQDPSQI